MLFDITALQPGAQSTLQIPSLHPVSTEAPQTVQSRRDAWLPTSKLPVFIYFIFKRKITFGNASMNKKACRFWRQFNRLSAAEGTD